MATFTSTNTPTILAELTDGQVIVCKTELQADGNYREWYEPAPVEWMYGWTESEQDIDEESITVVDSYDYETVKCSFNCHCNNSDKICHSEQSEESNAIKVIVEVLEEVDWHVNEGWEEDYQPDWDALAKEEKIKNEVA